MAKKKQAIPTVSGLFDTHAHLDDPRFQSDLPEVLDHARRAGVERILTVGAEPERLRAPVALAHQHPGIWAGVGLHAHEAKHYDETLEEALLSLLDEPRVVAVGEIGLDYHYMHSPREIQIGVFRKQLAIAADQGLPAVIHVREAHEDALAILREEVERCEGSLTGVIHCFSGDEDLAREYLDLGFSLGFGGVITFKRAETARRVAAMVPEDRLLLETDAPYLAPVPFRGRRCEPAHTAVTAVALADLRQTSPRSLARKTTHNGLQLFDRIRPPGTVAYELGRNLYLNITNDCDLDCRFCLKHQGYEFAGADLQLARPVTPADVLEAVSDRDLATYEEVVFCGLGEPTKALDTLLAAAHRLRALGAPRLRLDTDGLANLRHGRNVLADLGQVFDAISVSLNAQDAKTYAKLCPNPWGRAAHEAVMAFAAQAVQHGLEVRLTAVDLPEVDEQACRRLAGELGASFRLRP